jgi:uroporphyrinogen decarboxylase
MQVTLRDELARLGLDWDRLCQAADDKVGVGPAFTGKPGTNGWGIKTKTANYGGGSYEEFTDFPLGNITEVSQLRDYPWPSADPFDYAGLPAAIEKANPGRRRAMQSGGGNPFEIYCWLTGLEQSLTNMVVQPDIVVAALDHITSHMEAVLERSFKVIGPMVDLVFFADDLGTQNGLMISRQMYRDIIQPFHRRLATTAKKYAPRATRMFHSDGAVFDVLPDLLDAGVDMLEAVQTDAAGMDPRRLKDAFGDRLGFHGAISVQHLLPHTDEQTVDRECRRMVEILGKNGGYIAAPAHAIQVGTPVRNVPAMLRAVLGEEDYARLLAAAKT